MSALLDIRGIACRYHAHAIVQDLSFHANHHQIVCLLGPSGCGKTTVLRAIAGLEPVTAGEIILDGRVLSRRGHLVPPHKRGLGMVFQDYALFPHLNVKENICFGIRKKGRRERDEIASRLLETVGLEHFHKRYPHELSGGQQQRVALARALAVNPKLILLDEPFSNLDIDLRERLGTEIRELLVARGITTVLVTHDQHEAFALGDMVGIMNEGRILQWDTPFNLYHEPASRFVADFIGQGVFLPGTLLNAERVRTEVGIIRGNRAYPWPPGSAVDVLLRPDDVVPDPDSPLRALITHKAFKGAEILYTLKLPTGSRLLSLFPSHFHHEVGETVGIRIAADHLVAFLRPTADQNTMDQNGKRQTAGGESPPAVVSR